MSYLPPLILSSMASRLVVSERFSVKTYRQEKNVQPANKEEGWCIIACIYVWLLNFSVCAYLMYLH